MSSRPSPTLDSLRHALIEHDTSAVLRGLALKPQLSFEKDYLGRTLLMMALYSKEFKLASALLNQSDLSARDYDGRTVLQQVIASQSQDLFLPVFNAYQNMSFEGKAVAYQRSFIEASGVGDLSALKTLLPHVNPAAIHNGRTAMDVAVDQAQLESLQFLLSIPNVNYEMNPDSQPPQKTLLMRAAHANSLECFKLLMPYCSLSAADAHGNTALYHLLANKKENLEFLHFLIPKVDTYCANVNQWTPLMTAVRHKHLEAVKLLLPISDLEAKGQWGQDFLTPLEMAQRCKYDAIRDWMIGWISSQHEVKALSVASSQSDSGPAPRRTKRIHI